MEESCFLASLQREDSAEEGRDFAAPVRHGRIRHRALMMTLLVLLMMYSFVDRYAVGVLLQDIKADLHLSDTELGILTGIAFAFFYSIMGIPIARWADRGNRVRIIAISTGLLSACIALCGLASNFIQLLVVRVGIGVGEAGNVPPAFSLIADYFDKAERPRAYAHYNLGGPLAAFVGYFGAALLSEQWGWRGALLILAVPGLALALLSWFLLAEPRRANGTISRTNAAPANARPSLSFMRMIAILWAGRASRHVLIAFVVFSFFLSGLLQWQPAFFARTHAIGSAQLGTWLALIFASAGLLGVYIGGEVASRFAANNEVLQLRAMMVVLAAAGACFAMTYLSSNLAAALSALWLAVFAQSVITGPLLSVLQIVIPPQMRASGLAIVFLFSNLIGLGLGPVAVGMISDALAPSAGQASLKYALLFFSPGYLWIGAHLLLASLHFKASVSSS